MKYVLLFAVVVAACSCSSREEPKPTTHVAEPTDAIDQELMVALLQAKNFHHKAKIYMADGNTPAAIASVREILSLKFPAGAPEADDVRNDARALLAKLLAGQGQLDEAMRVVEEGIAQSPRESFFVANLYTVKGEIHQARDEKHAAIEAWDKSIEINKRLQARLMEER